MSQTNLPPVSDIVAEALPPARQRLAQALRNNRTNELRYSSEQFPHNTHIELLRELVEAGWRYRFESNGNGTGIYVISPDPERLERLRFAREERRPHPLPTVTDVLQEILPNVRTRVASLLRSQRTREVRLNSEELFGATHVVILNELSEQGWDVRYEPNGATGVYVITPNLERAKRGAVERDAANATPAQALPSVHTVLAETLPAVRQRIASFVRQNRTREFRIGAEEFTPATFLVIKQELESQGWNIRTDMSTGNPVYIVRPSYEEVERLRFPELAQRYPIPSVHDVLNEALPAVRQRVVSYLRNRRTAEVRIGAEEFVGATAPVMIKELNAAGWNCRYEGGSGSGVYVIIPNLEQVESLPVPQVSELPEASDTRERSLVQARSVLAARMAQSAGTPFEYPAKNFPGDTARLLLAELSAKGWTHEFRPATLSQPAMYLIQPAR